MTYKAKLSWLIYRSITYTEQHLQSKFTKTKKKRKRRGCRRYYIRATGNNHSRIANKSAYLNPNPSRYKSNVALPVLPYSKKLADFDTDSFLIGVDNHATRCISNDINHFIGPIIPNKRKCTGFGGSQTETMGEGTIKWKWLDDNGILHTTMIKDSLYVPASTICLLSPQHVDKNVRRMSNNKSRFKESTDSNRCVTTLSRGSKEYNKTVKLSTRTNTPVFRTAPSNKVFNTYCMECEEEFNSKDMEVTVLSTELVVRDNDVEMLPILAPAPHESNNIMGSTSQTIAASTDEGELLR